jgi:hypothetical protein
MQGIINYSLQPPKVEKHRVSERIMMENMTWGALLVRISAFAVAFPLTPQCLN